MKNFFRYFLLAAALSACLNTVHAQGSNNIPTVDSPINIAPVDYPGLINMNSTLKKNVLTTIIPDQPLQSLPTGAYKFQQRKDYVDGLGRPLQSVERNAGPDSFDIIKAYVYDSLGREQYQYQPFAVRVSSATSSGNIRMDVKTRMRAFYDGAAYDEQPYGRTDFEPSSLGRPLKQLSPGKSWVGSNRGQEFQYQHNVANEVLNWTIGKELHAVPNMQSIYAPGELSVSVVTDEDGNKSREYTDKNGRLILKKMMEINGTPDPSFSGYACTYYVYDDQSRLRYVIPPAAIRTMTSTVWDVGTVKEYCYSYDYDHRGRLIEKKIPGKDPEEFVYDKRDRLVFSRDGNLAGQDKWTFALYDALDRQIATGIAEGGGRSRQAVADLVMDNFPYGLSDLVYYIKNYDLYHVYPSNLPGCQFLSYTYYDNYDPLPGFSYDPTQFDNETSTLPEFDQPVLSTVTRGLVTGSKIKIQDPEDPAGDKWIKTVNYYDNKGRLLQTQSPNRLKGLDISSNLYYFQGMVWKNILRHQNPDAQQIPGAIDSAITTFKLVRTSTRNIRDYGGSDQVIKLEQKINGGPLYNISQYHYDHLNRTVLKDYSGSMVLNEYNMRGFINHISAKDQNGTQTRSLFDERIRYDWGFKSKYYNGNIAGIIWSYSSGESEAYGYSYDKLDRLTYAEYRNFLPPSGGGQPSWIKTNRDYSVSNITYDINGNLLTMNQKAGKYKNLNVVRNMDLLTYTYEPNTNKLVGVEDGGDVIDGLPDFRNGASTTEEYHYDPNGNMTQDDNKHLSIAYNHLNKPLTISVEGKGTFYYTYDATGNLLKKVVDSSGVRTIYDYFGNFVYKDNVLQFILNEEGRTRPIANDTTAGYTRFVYDYFIKDHLGNVRSTVTAEPINSGYFASHEVATASVEQLVFDNIPNVRDAKPGSINPNDGMAAHLDAANPDTRVGTAIMLKVMPGDKFTITASAHYDGEYHGGEETGTQPMIESLTNALMGGGTYAGVPVSELPENIRTVQNILGNPALPGQLTTLQSNDLGTAPKAHLNYLFFDDKFQLQSDLSGAIQVTPAGNIGWEILNPGNICNCTISPVGPNGGVAGYFLVYIDNQSIGKSVWFDDMHIEHFTSKVLEETHYYPFGLTVGVGKTGQGNLPKQPYKYNGKELEKSLELEYYYYGARQYDPQRGQWTGIDPLADKYNETSPFAYALNNPIKYIDPDGRKVEITTKKSNSSEKEQINIALTGKLVNESSKTFTPEQMTQFAERSATSISTAYSGKDGDLSWITVANLGIASEENPINSTDHIVHLVNPEDVPQGAESDALGSTLGGSKDIYLSTELLDENRKPATEGFFKGTGKTTNGKGTLERTISHEFGHGNTLDHPELGTLDGNVMHQTKWQNAGLKTTKSQILQIRKAYKEGRLNLDYEKPTKK